MRKTITFLTLVLWAAVLLAQTCPDCRFDSYVFDSVSVSTVQFGQGVNGLGDNQDLFMDIYEPHGDTLSNRPVIVFAFGGGFIQGHREEDYVVASCKRFARAGYVTASIDYRIGFSIPGLFPDPTEELMRVFFRAMQDMRGSVQWFRAHADQMGNTLQIDTNKIIIGGASSGGITACMVAYCDKSTEIMEIADTSALDQLGGFNSSSGTYSSYSWEPLMVFNIAGALVNVNWMEPGDPPIFSAHGDLDATVPFKGGNLDLGFSSVGLEGSFNVDERADSLGICSYLYTMVGEDHPSGGADEEYYDAIFNRCMPRLHAIISGKSFCCPLRVNISPDSLVQSSPGAAINLQANLTGDNGSASVRWCEASCGIQQNGLQLNATPASLPTYIIAVATEGQCIETDYVRVEAITTTLAEMTEPAHFQYFPNPAKDKIVILRKNGASAKLQIRDLHGKILQQQTLTGPSSKISIQGLPSGIYFIRLEGKDGLSSQKLLIE